MTTPSESTEHIEALVALETFRLYVRDWMSANAVIPDEIRAPVKGQPLSPEMKQWVVEFRRKLGSHGMDRSQLAPQVRRWRAARRVRLGCAA